jgi:hypothetical protein
VEGAGAYALALFSPDGSEILSARLREPSWFLDDLSVLGRGQFRWEVRALRSPPSPEEEEQGPVSESRFTVDLPDLRRNTLQDLGSLYGR